MGYFILAFCAEMRAIQYNQHFIIPSKLLHMKKWLLFTAFVLFILACTHEQLTNPLDTQLEEKLLRLSPSQTLDYFRLPESTDLRAIPQIAQNPLTAEKVELGRMLFYETGVGLDSKHSNGKGTYSCASCHIPTAGFMAGRVQGIADGGFGFGRNGEGRDKMDNYAPNELDAQEIRPISILNVAYVTNTFWNGQFGVGFNNEGTEAIWQNNPDLIPGNALGLNGPEAQNMVGTITHRMNTDNTYVLDTLGYRAMFDAAFPDLPKSERYGRKGHSFALSAYIRTLLPTKAPFQQWVKGDLNAMNDQEKRGALLFYGKAGCYRCHKGASTNSNEFQAVGVSDLYEAPGVYNPSPEHKRNLGRGGHTGNPADNYKFKVPSIYNMKDSPFYFHGSSKHSLTEVVEYFNLAIPENPRVPKSNISPFFQPLHLTDEEKADLLAFLRDGLYDPELQRYAPQRVLSGNCFPDNDPTSQKDMGCK